MPDQNEKPRFATLHYGVRSQLNITWSEYVLLDMVYHLSAKYGFCFKSITAIAEDLGQSFNGTKYLVQRLLDRELLIKESRGFKCSSAYIDIAYLEKDVTSSQTAKSAMKKHVIISQTAKIDGKLRKVQQTAKSSDKSYNRSTIEISAGYKKAKEIRDKLVGRTKLN